MRKAILVLFVFVISMCSAFALFEKKNKKPVLFLSNENPQVLLEYDKLITNHSVFKKGKKIYFLVYNPKGFMSDYIKLQIIKQDDNAHVGGYTRIRNMTKRVKNKNYYVDYFVLNETGKYALQVFDIVDLHKWIVFGHFRVIEE